MLYDSRSTLYNQCFLISLYSYSFKSMKTK
nr:MAG TPA: hypothetical protein [Bacteriophage sp.]